MCSSFFIVPYCYGVLFRSLEMNNLMYMYNKYLRFTLLQNKNTVGLSEAARAKRKRRNVVTMKFNLLNYLLETASMMLTLAVRGYLVGLLQLLVTSCGTPLVYYLGMEDNRQSVALLSKTMYLYVTHRIENNIM